MEPDPVPAPIYSNADEAALRERLQKLESLVATLQSPTAAAPPAGFSPSLPAPLMLLSAAAENARRHWLDWAIIRELRFIAFMYLDPRYRLSRLGQFGIPGVFIAAVVNYLVLNYLIVTIPFVTQFTERAILIFLGMVLYLLLLREGARYRNVLEYLARHGV
jgi:hypothetical protein